MWFIELEKDTATDTLLLQLHDLTAPWVAVKYAKCATKQFMGETVCIPLLVLTSLFNKGHGWGDGESFCWQAQAAGAVISTTTKQPRNSKGTGCCASTLHAATYTSLVTLLLQSVLNTPKGTEKAQLHTGRSIGMLDACEH